MCGSYSVQLKYYIVMELKYNKVNKVEILNDILYARRFQLRIDVRQTISELSRFIEVKHGNRYLLQCQNDILHDLWHTKHVDHLATTIPHQIRPYDRVIDTLLSGKLHATSPLLNSSTDMVGSKETWRLSRLM